VLLVHSKLGGNEDTAPSGQSVPASRPWVEAVEQGMDVWHVRALLGVSRLVSMFRRCSRPTRSGPITLDAKSAGARSAGNPHATCDGAGTGIPFTVRLVRHSQRKQGATDRPDLRNNGASPRPYRDRGDGNDQEGESETSGKRRHGSPDEVRRQAVRNRCIENR